MRMRLANAIPRLAEEQLPDRPEDQLRLRLSARRHLDRLIKERSGWLESRLRLKR
jgi:hypothetical protein